MYEIGSMLLPCFYQPNLTTTSPQSYLTYLHRYLENIGVDRFKILEFGADALLKFQSLNLNRQ